MLFSFSYAWLMTSMSLTTNMGFFFSEFSLTFCHLKEFLREKLHAITDFHGLRGRLIFSYECGNTLHSFICILSFKKGNCYLTCLRSIKKELPASLRDVRSWAYVVKGKFAMKFVYLVSFAKNDLIVKLRAKTRILSVP